MVELKRLDVEPIHQQFRTVREILKRFEISSTDGQAVNDVYQLSRELFAPYIGSVLRQMLPSLTRDVEGSRNGNVKLALCGRDSHALSAWLAGRHPDFHAEYCVDIAISRVTSAMAFRDGRQRGLIPSSPGGEQGWPDRVFAVTDAPLNSSSAYEAMERYLQRRSLPVGRVRGGKVVVVDWSCGLGTSQEYLAASFPGTEFVGRYFVTSLSPDDLHRESKHGYVSHGLAPRHQDGVPEPHYAMVSRGAWVPENVLSGPWSTPFTVGPDGPVQKLQGSNRANRAIPVDFDPALFGRYRQWNVWAAGKAAALLAVYDCARATPADVDPEWSITSIRRGQDPLSTQVRGWTFPQTRVPVSDAPRRIFDAYVPRPEHGFRFAPATQATSHIQNTGTLPVLRHLRPAGDMSVRHSGSAAVVVPAVTVRTPPAIHALHSEAADLLGTTSVTGLESTNAATGLRRGAGPVVQVDKAQWADWRRATTDARTTALDDLRSANAQALRTYLKEGPGAAASAFQAAVRLAYGDATNQLLDHEQRMLAHYAPHSEIAPDQGPELMRDEHLVKTLAAALPPNPAVSSQTRDHSDGSTRLPPLSPADPHGAAPRRPAGRTARATEQVAGHETRLSR